MGICIWCLPYLKANIWMFVHAPNAVEKGMPLFVGMFQVMIATGSLLGGYVVDHFNENTLIYGVLSFVAPSITEYIYHERS